MFKTTNHKEVVDTIKYVAEKMPNIKTIIVDDVQYVLIYELMDRASEKGYDKFTQLAQHYLDVLRCPDDLREDLTVIYLSHSQETEGVTKMKTIGKMLDNTVTLEGLFTIVLLATCYRDVDKTIKHVFMTKNSGNTTAKSPDGMFEGNEIPNDLQYVLDKITEYNG